MSAEATPVPAQETTLGAIWRWTAPMRGSLAAGLIAGFFVAGLGSRIAMLIIALVDPSTEGALTQDQFIVGDRSLSDTMNLILLGTFLGVVGAFIYLGMRRWMPIPRSIRGLAFGYGALVTGGNLLINPDSVDFRTFEPVLLSIALFASLFLLWGVVLCALADRFHREPDYPPSVRAPRIVGGVLVVITLLGTALMAGGIIELVDKEGTCIGANEGSKCIPARNAD